MHTEHQETKRRQFVKQYQRRSLGGPSGEVNCFRIQIKGTCFDKIEAANGAVHQHQFLVVFSTRLLTSVHQVLRGRRRSLTLVPISSQFQIIYRDVIMHHPDGL